MQVRAVGCQPSIIREKASALQMHKCPWLVPTICGEHLRGNDRVFISWVAANHGEQEFEHADEIALDRSPNRHLASGSGRIAASDLIWRVSFPR
jgi:hypothetical protein